VPVTHRLGDRLHQVGRGLEAEGDRISNVEVSNFCAGGLDSLGLNDDITDSV